MAPIPVEGGARWWPDRGNPLFTAIVARYVSPSEGKKHLEPKEIGPALREAAKRLQFRFDRSEKEKAEDFLRDKAETDKTLPDMIIFGDSTFMLPYTGWKDGSLA